MPYGLDPPDEAKRIPGADRSTWHLCSLCGHKKMRTIALESGHRVCVECRDPGEATVRDLDAL